MEEEAPCIDPAFAPLEGMVHHSPNNPTQELYLNEYINSFDLTISDITQCNILQKGFSTDLFSNFSTKWRI